MTHSAWLFRKVFSARKPYRSNHRGLRICRPSIEALEDRAVPAAYSLRALADGYAYDRARDGTFEGLNQTGSTIQTSLSTSPNIGEERGLFEFDMINVPTSTVVTSARVVGNIGLMQYGSAGLQVGFYGYNGDGGLSTADATAAGTLVGTLVNPSLGEFAVEIDPAFIQSQLTSNPRKVAGFQLRILSSGSDRLFIDSTEGPATHAAPKPWLQINYDQNAAPVAVAESYNAYEDTTLTVSNPGVLANDTNTDGPSALQAILVDRPLHFSTFSLSTSGGFTYRASANYSGPDRFTYKVYDGITYSNIVTVSISVNPLADAPVAVNNSYTLLEDNTLTVTAPGVLGNDSDGDGDPLTASLLSNPTKGTLNFNSDGSFVYTPNANVSGTDSFTYRASDGTLTSNTATVTLTITAVQDPPVANNDAYSMNRGGILSVAASGVLANDTKDTAFAGTALTAILVSGPANGALMLNSNGSFTYTPTVSFTGTDTFTYKARDGFLEGNVATVTITVNDVNNAPVSGNDSYTVATGSTLNITAPGVLVNDTDANRDPLTAVLATGPANGSLTLNADGSFTYTPNVGFGGNDTFTYRADDSRTTGNLATVTIRVNAPPTANPDSYSTNEDTTLTVFAPGLLGNDSDPNGDALTVVVVSQPTHGSLSYTASTGAFTYYPTTDYNGPDSFTYKVRDTTSLESNVVTVSLTVNPVNDPPTAPNPQYNVDEDTVLTVPASSGVLVNARDNDGDPLTAVLVDTTARGTLNFNADGSFTYMPNANFQGTDRFTYRVSDGTATSGLGTVTIGVRAVQDAPVANDDAYTLDEDQSLTITAAPAVTSLTMVSQPGDYIGGGQTYNYNPSMGTFTAYRGAGGAATVSYSAFGNISDYWYLDFAAPYNALLAPGFYDNATRYPFQDMSVPGLSVSGQHRGSNTLTGKFTILQAVYATSGQVLRFAADFEQHSGGAPPALTGQVRYNYLASMPGVLANDTDADQNPLAALLVSGPANGSLTLNADGTFTYTPNANFHGTDSFSYKVNDGLLDSNVATVTLTVRSIDDGPAVAANDSYSTNEDTTLTVTTPGVLANDADTIDGDALSAVLASGPANGALTLNGNGSFSYTPNANFNGTDSFTYRASDGTGTSNLATVTITVNAVNDAPTASADAYAVNEDNTLTVAAAGVLANDADIDGDALTAALASAPGNGTLTLNAAGSFTYTPNANFNGTDSFAYRAADGASSSTAVTVTITVNPVNDAPTAVGDAFSTDEDTTLVVPFSTLLANDTDVEGDALTAILATGAANGTVTLDSSGTFFLYVPNANFNGVDSFTYRASDGTLSSNPVTVTITVRPINDAPVANANTYAVDEEGTLSVAAAGVLANDTDIDGDTLIAALVSGPANGTLSLNPNGSFTYTPSANFNGTDSFTYRAGDGSAQSNTATVTITVNALNDAPVAIVDSYAVDEDTTLTIAAPGVLGNDTDVDSSALTAVLVSGPANGSLILNANGSFTYTPNANFNGTDSFTYRASDGLASSNTAAVTITVRPVNDAPVANAGLDLAGNEGSPVTFNGGASSDVDGDVLTYSWNFGDGSTGSGVSPSHIYADNGPYAVTLTVTDGKGGSSTDTVLVAVANMAPTISLSGANSVNEASVYTLQLAASDPGTDAISSWQINWGDGSVQTVAGNLTSVTHIYADGPADRTISASATDEDGTYTASNTVAVHINNVAPTASITGLATGVRGQSRTFTLGATDPSAADQGANFTFQIAWGDGSTQTVTGPAGTQVEHTFAAAGSFTVSVTATDRSGGTSTAATHALTINAVELQGTTLVIGGTTAADTIVVAPADRNGRVTVTINGQAQGTFLPSRIVVYAQAGNDVVDFNTSRIQNKTTYVTAPAVLFGGDGADTLDTTGSTANNVLVGGAGNDTLLADGGRDILIGGMGADVLRGGSGDDILIGGTTAHDANLAAIDALMAEWGRTTADYTTRVGHLRGTLSGGLNGSTLLNAATLFADDGIDDLYGEGNTDWFIHVGSGTLKDRVRDRKSGELETTL